MSLKKRFTGDFTIEAIDPSGSVIINADLTVTGTQTIVNTTDLDIIDNIIVLNSGESGSVVTLGAAGIDVDRGSGNNAGIQFNETGTVWQINNGTGWVDIATATGGSDVVLDLTPELGGNLDVNGKSITSAAAANVIIVAGANGDVVITGGATTGDIIMSAPGVVKVDQELTLLEQSAPSSLASYNKLYANTPAAGGTGLYFVNTTETDELVSKKKAIAYSIIF